MATVLVEEFAQTESSRTHTLAYPGASACIWAHACLHTGNHTLLQKWLCMHSCTSRYMHTFTTPHVHLMYVAHTESCRHMPYTYTCTPLPPRAHTPMHTHTHTHTHTRGPMPLAHTQVQRSRLANPRARPVSVVSSEKRAQGREGRADVVSC